MTTQGPRGAWARLRSRLQRDEVRIPIQTAAAVLLAYFASSFMSREDVSWAVFSSLFVVQASIGGTIGAALGRIAGAILGAAIAVGLVLLLGDEGDSPLVGLLLGVGLMSFLTAKWPQFAYGLVTVTIIAIAPDFYLIEGALKKVIAIAIGSICGMVAAFAVFPVQARRSEQYHLAAALRSCGAYVVECTTCLVGDKADKNKEAQEIIQRSIERARVLAREAAIEDKTPAMGYSPFSRSLLPEIERLGYTLALVDRFSDQAMSDALCETHKDALLGLANAIKDSLEQMASAVEAGEACDENDAARAAYTEFAKRVDSSIADSALCMEDQQHMMSLKGAYGSILANLSDLASEVQRRSDKAKRAGVSAQS